MTYLLRWQSALAARTSLSLLSVLWLSTAVRHLWCEKSTLIGCPLPGYPRSAGIFTVSMFYLKSTFEKRSVAQSTTKTFLKRQVTYSLVTGKRRPVPGCACAVGSSASIITSIESVSHSLFQRTPSLSDVWNSRTPLSLNVTSLFSVF